MTTRIGRAFDLGMKNAKESIPSIPDWILTDPDCLESYRNGFEDQKEAVTAHREKKTRDSDNHAHGQRCELDLSFKGGITLHAVTGDPTDVVLNIDRGTSAESPFGLPVFRDEDSATDYATRKRLGVFTFNIIPVSWEMYDDGAPIGSPEEVERLIEFKTRDIKVYYENLKKVQGMDHSFADLAIQDYEKTFRRLYEESYTAFADDWMESGLGEETD